MLGCVLLRLLVTAGQLVQQLNDGPDGASGHAPIFEVGEVVGALDISGRRDVEVQPIGAGDELLENWVLLHSTPF